MDRRLVKIEWKNSNAGNISFNPYLMKKVGIE
jgi:hypothetical protein